MTFYYLTLISFFALIISLISWITLAPHSPLFPTSSVLTIALFPLLIPLRGLLHRAPRSFIWNSFLMLAYFSHGVGELYSAEYFDIYPFFTILLSSLCFIFSLLFIRFEAKTSPMSQKK